MDREGEPTLSQEEGSLHNTGRRACVGDIAIACPQIDDTLLVYNKMLPE